MTDNLKPVDDTYVREIHVFEPGGRLHRLVSRLADTHIDDLTDERIVALERLLDGWRITHANGEAFPHPDDARVDMRLAADGLALPKQD